MKNVDQDRSEEFMKRWENFKVTLPHMHPPYSKRNWGNGLHSVCSYQGKMKPALASFLVKVFSDENDLVLDPFSGSGTIPFEAALNNRKSLGIDISLLAASLSNAKLMAYDETEVFSIIDNLSEYIEFNKPSKKTILDSEEVKFNKTISEYFHPNTLTEILTARDFFIKFHIPENKLNKLMTLRNKLADKFNIAPSSFINDRVIMNIHDNSPKNITELWAIDGISDMFIMSPGCSEFMDEYTQLRKQYASTKGNQKTKSRKGKTGKTGKTRNNIYELYKQGKTMKEMSQILSLKMQTIESHILYLYENNDIEVDLNYFELTSEKQECINIAIKKVGTTFLKPIKDIVGKTVTYGQIKLCILLNKI